jgi:hypothetical protein
MKVLIIGRGVVETIYGWALSKAGIDVTHVVRKEGLRATETLDLLELRTGYPKYTRVTYAPRAVRQISPSDWFDLLIVATKHRRPLHTWVSSAPHTTWIELWMGGDKTSGSRILSLVANQTSSPHPIRSAVSFGTFQKTFRRVVGLCSGTTAREGVLL